jgi:hypothetical protein
MRQWFRYCHEIPITDPILQKRIAKASLVVHDILDEQMEGLLHLIGETELAEWERPENKGLWQSFKAAFTSFDSFSEHARASYLLRWMIACQAEFPERSRCENYLRAC